jgi:predicted site-specific integrase-resolvase
MKLIRLIFVKERETFVIEISNKIIHYKDRKRPVKIQFMPKDPDIKKKVIMSRNRIPKYILELIEDANSGHNLEEYQACKTDEELVPIVKRDAFSKGCVFQKREDIEG